MPCFGGRQPCAATGDLKPRPMSRAEPETRRPAASNLEGELRACLELGQDLLRTPLGEGYTPSALESDLDAGEEAYSRAAAIAEQTGNDSMLAMALRELGVIRLARIREWFVERVKAGDHIPILQAIGQGVPIEELEKTLPIADDVVATRDVLTRALGAFREGRRPAWRHGDDRQPGLPAMGARNAPRTNPAQRFEGIRQLANTMDTLVAESERENNEAQMLYGVHVFARSKLIPDLAVQRGEEAFQRARSLGDNRLEFLAAIGTTHAYLELGETETASQWLGRASAAAATAPTPHRARASGAWRTRCWRPPRATSERMRTGLDRSCSQRGGTTPAGRAVRSGCAARAAYGAGGREQRR